jgi:hypothetical protein
MLMTAEKEQHRMIALNRCELKDDAMIICSVF